MSIKKNLKKRNALGRGLEALLKDSSVDLSLRPAQNKLKAIGNISEIAINQIEANPFQPRTEFDKESLNELVESIKVQGIIQPITLRKLNNNSYQLISGERRLQASKIVGLKRIPSYIRTVNDQQMLEMALIENIQREDLNAMEIALSYQRLLKDCKLKQEDLGDRVGKKRSTVNNYLRLLKLPPNIQIAVRDKKISMGHARALVSVENLVVQQDIYKKILSDDLSVRKVEMLVKQATLSKDKANKNTDKTTGNKELSQWQEKLSSHFSTKIKIIANLQNKGEIKIPFSDVSELNRILEIIDL